VANRDLNLPSFWRNTGAAQPEAPVARRRVGGKLLLKVETVKHAVTFIFLNYINILIRFIYLRFGAELV